MINRRDFIKATAASLGAGLAACASPAPPTMASTPIQGLPIYNELPALQNGAMKFGVGVYNLPAPLDASLYPISGEGPNFTVIIPASGQDAIQFTNATNGLKYGFSVSNLTIQDSGTRTSKGINLNGNLTGGDKRISDIFITNVRFEYLSTGLKLGYGANVYLHGCKTSQCGIGFHFYEAADVGITNCKTQLSTQYGTLVEGQTLPYNEGLNASVLVSNGDNVGIRFRRYDFGHLVGCSFTSCFINAVEGSDSDNIKFTNGNVSNTLGQGSGIVLDGDCWRWNIGDVQVDNVTLFGVVLRGKWHNLHDCHFVNIGNVPVYIEATDCEIHSLSQETSAVSWFILEAGGANRNYPHDCKRRIGSVTLVGAQSLGWNN